MGNISVHLLSPLDFPYLLGQILQLALVVLLAGNDIFRNSGENLLFSQVQCL